MPPPDAVSDSEYLLLIADISGYTKFMLTNRTARVHAHGIVSDLLAAVAAAARPPLAVNKFEGDAIFMIAGRAATDWAEIGRNLGTGLSELIDAFDAKLSELAASNLCDCIACQQMVTLRLKVIAHYGEAVRSQVAGFDEVSGVDVIVLHRLLKNQIQGSEYILLTEPAHAFLDPPGEYAHHRESYDDIGEWPLRLRSLHANVPDSAPRRFSLKDAIRKMGYDIRYVLARQKHPAE